MLRVPALEPDPNRVATTSPAIVTDLLKHELGFQGIVVTDALDMAGLTRLYSANIGRAAVDAFKAGNDLLLIPADLDASYKAVLEAARSGEIPSAQLDASVLKLLKAKASLGLHKARLVDVDALPDTMGKPENLALGQQIADDAVTLVRDNGKLLPLKQSGTVNSGIPYQQVEEVHNRVVVVVLSEDIRTEAGRALERSIKARVPDANVIYVDTRTATRHVRGDPESGGPGASRDCSRLCGANRRQGHERRGRFDQFGFPERCQRHAPADDSGPRSRRKPRSWPWEIRTWRRIFPRYRIICAPFPMPASRKSARSKLFLAKSPFAAACRSVFPISLSAAPALSDRQSS